MAVTVEEGGGGARLQERTELLSGSLVWKISWEEEITAAVTVDTLRTTIPATTIPATTIPATTTPATTTSSRVDASVTTS